MGACFSKKTPSPPPPLPPLPLPPPPPSAVLPAPTPPPPTTGEETVKKEIFIIKQRKSHERRPEDRPHIAKLPQSPSPPSSVVIEKAIATPVRTSSCSKEEVDAILIQCGRLSRSSSGNAVGGEGGRKYSGSKRSFDFDQENKNELVEDTRGSHRRTPSREKDEECKRSGSNRHRSSSTSREEERKRNAAGGSTSRRLSRSPGRRSETTNVSSSSSSTKAPGKMVSVPASTTGAIKRVSVKRSTASPRSQSPANARENAPRSQSPANARENAPSLSRSSSRKAESSPYRRNPLVEIDDNCQKTEQIPYKQQEKKSIGTNSKVQSSKEVEEGIATKKAFQFQSNSQSQKTDDRNSSIITENKNKKNLSDEGNESRRSEGIETHKQPQTITRTRSSRRSRDLDFLNNGSPNDDDPLVNVPTSYASLLLEDIQNFHQKNSNTTTATTFTLPACVTKACSILDAVADLNSSTTSHVSNTEGIGNVSNSSNNNSTLKASSSGAKSSEVVSKDPFVETEVFVYDDIMEPNIHKYITVRRGGDMEQQESSGSNSVVGQQQQWLSSSSWEPNSADSTDHWTSSSNTGDDKEEPSNPKRKVYSEGARKLRSSGNCSTHLNSVSGKKREIDQHSHVGKIGGRTHTAASM